MGRRPRNNNDVSEPTVKLRAEHAPTTKNWHPAFLKCLADTSNIAAACRAAGVDRSTAYRHRARCRVFRRKWAELQEESVDLLEAELRRRALSQDDRASHTLLMFLLKAYRPHVYGDKDEAPPFPEEEPGPVLSADVLARLSTDELNALEAISRKLGGEA